MKRGEGKGEVEGEVSVLYVPPVSCDCVVVTGAVLVIRIGGASSYVHHTNFPRDAVETNESVLLDFSLACIGLTIQ